MGINIEQEIYNKYYAIAECIANELDKCDGTVDNQISKSIWDEFADQYNGNHIQSSISVQDAIKSICIYLDQKAKNLMFSNTKAVATDVSTQVVDCNTTSSNDPMWQHNYNIVETQLVKRIPLGKGKGHAKKISDLPASLQAEYRNKANYITNLVIKNCKKYNIKELTPLVAEMLGVETGGYELKSDAVVNGRKLGNGDRSNFKGVMQVNKDICRILYGEGDGKYEHDHYVQQDIKRINELKLKYPTAEALFEAQRQDPELGLEVGIMALKFKIRKCGNNVRKGLANYCGDQYKCTDKTVPQKLNIGKREYLG